MEMGEFNNIIYTCHIINTFTYDLKILNNVILFTFYTIALNRGGQINRLLPVDCHRTITD
jgi:hypothetical protein